MSAAPAERATLAARNTQRFKWHERVVGDHQALPPAAILLAGFIMHRYSARDGHVTVSMRTASKELKMLRWTAQCAAGLLVERGWLYRLNPGPVIGSRNPPAKFALLDGPQDAEGDGLGQEAIGPRPEGHDGLGAKATSSVRVSDSLPCKESSRKIQKEKRGGRAVLVAAIMQANNCTRAEAERRFASLKMTS